MRFRSWASLMTRLEHLEGSRRGADRLVLFEQVGHAEDRGERGAQFVGGVGHELVAGFAQFLLGLQAHLQFLLAVLAAGQLAVDDHRRERHHEGHQEAGDVAHPAHGVVGGGDLGSLIVALHHHRVGEQAEVAVEGLVEDGPQPCAVPRLGEPEELRHRGAEGGRGALDGRGGLGAVSLQVGHCRGQVAEGESGVAHRYLDRGHRVEAGLLLQHHEVGGHARLGPGDRGGPQRLVGGVQGLGVLGHPLGAEGDREDQGEHQSQAHAECEGDGGPPAAAARGSRGHPRRSRGGLGHRPRYRRPGASG